MLPSPDKIVSAYMTRDLQSSLLLVYIHRQTVLKVRQNPVQLTTAGSPAADQTAMLVIRPTYAGKAYSNSRQERKATMLASRPVTAAIGAQGGLLRRLDCTACVTPMTYDSQPPSQGDNIGSLRENAKRRCLISGMSPLANSHAASRLIR